MSATDIYLDTSAIAAYYCPEPLSAKAEKALLKTGTPVISELTQLELTSAVARKIRGKQFALETGQSVLSLFQSHLGKGMFRLIAIESRHWQKSWEWIGRFDAPLRSLDAIHLAVAACEGLPILTLDRQMALSARKLGLAVHLIA